MFITNKKGTTSIAIVLIVILTLALSLSMLVYFNVKTLKFNENLGEYLIVKEVYRDAEVLNFNLERSLEVALESDDFESTLNSRIELLEELFDDSDFEILSQDVKFDGNGYEANFEILISKQKENFQVQHKYTKTFINK